MPRTPRPLTPTVADRLRELVDHLLGRPVQPVLAPVPVRRPQPVRLRDARR